MYAIISDGGRQYKVEEGRFVDIDFRAGLNEGDSIEFASVLAVGGLDDGMKLGSPMLSGAKVVGKVLDKVAGPKVFIQKFQRRKHYDKRTGHRQKYTRISIETITV